MNDNYSCDLTRSFGRAASSLTMTVYSWIWKEAFFEGRYSLLSFSDLPIDCRELALQQKQLGTFLQRHSHSLLGNDRHNDSAKISFLDDLYPIHCIQWVEVVNNQDCYLYNNNFFCALRFIFNNYQVSLVLAYIQSRVAWPGVHP